MLQTCKREGEGLLPISTSPVGRHLPGCLREVPSALFDSTVKTKGPGPQSLVQSSSLPYRYYQGSGTAAETRSSQFSPNPLTQVTQEPEPRSPEASPKSCTSFMDHIQLQRGREHLYRTDLLSETFSRIKRSCLRAASGGLGIYTKVFKTAGPQTG